MLVPCSDGQPLGVASHPPGPEIDTEGGLIMARDGILTNIIRSPTVCVSIRGDSTGVLSNRLREPCADGLAGWGVVPGRCVHD